MAFSDDNRAGWTRIDDLGDDTCRPLPLGFTFNGFGTSTAAVSLSSNGVLFLGSQCFPAFANTTLPTGITAAPALFFFWDDLVDYGSGEFAEHVTLGEAGGRTFQLYVRMRLRNDICGTAAVTAMISVHERSGLVKVSYPTVDDCAPLRGSGATLGFQAAGGSSAEAFSVAANSPVLDDDTPGQSMSFHPPN